MHAIARTTGLWVPVALLSVGACGPVGDSPAGEGAGPSHPELPTLLTWQEGTATFDAIVRGRLRINEAGCFAVDEAILVAPPGSTVIASGDAIEVPGAGNVALGTQVEWGGGYVDVDSMPHADGFQECVTSTTNLFALAGDVSE